MTSARSAIVGLWGASHPGPTLVVTALAAALGIAVGLEPWRLVLLAVAVFAGQLSVGISNDALDASRDRATGRRDKPLARGAVSVGAAWGAASCSLLVALALSAGLGWWMLCAHALVLGSAWAYNAGLKSTVFSLAPFVVSFGLFPSLATLSAPQPVFAAPWAWIAGAALGAAVHLTNVLPDLDDDARTGVRGLPHRWGGRVSALVACAGVLAGAVAVLLGPGGAISPVAWVFFGAVLVVTAVASAWTLLRPPSRVLFRLVMLAALLLAAQLVATGSALTS